MYQRPTHSPNHCEDLDVAGQRRESKMLRMVMLLLMLLLLMRLMMLGSTRAALSVLFLRIRFLFLMLLLIVTQRDPPLLLLRALAFGVVLSVLLIYGGDGASGCRCGGVGYRVVVAIIGCNGVLRGVGVVVMCAADRETLLVGV